MSNVKFNLLKYFYAINLLLTTFRSSLLLDKVN